jgi:menaquinone-dependent protoporphyrinogen IX oxidase
VKTIVVYYSKSGNNKYLAEKVAKTLACDIEEIKPRVTAFFLLLFNLSFGNKPLKHNLKKYDRVILCGPIWMGKFVSPLKSFVKKYSKSIQQLYFITCCGSTDEKKDEKFGHNLVFKHVKELLGEKCIHCEAFPIVLVLPEDQKGNDDAIMKTHLSDDNFAGEIKQRFDNFIRSIA